jgi:hypothetical protein
MKKISFFVIFAFLFGWQCYQIYRVERLISDLNEVISNMNPERHDQAAKNQDLYLQQMSLNQDFQIFYVTVLFFILGLGGWAFFEDKIKEQFRIQNETIKKQHDKISENSVITRITSGNIFMYQSDDFTDIQKKAWFKLVAGYHFVLAISESMDAGKKIRIEQDAFKNLNEYLHIIFSHKIKATTSHFATHSSELVPILTKLIELTKNSNTLRGVVERIRVQLF